MNLVLHCRSSVPTTAILLLLLSCCAAAQWEPIKTPGACKVYSIAVDANRMVAGTDRGGIFLSTDHGRSWKSIRNDPDLVTDPVLSVALAEGGIWIGTQFRGVFWSTNAGQQWTMASIIDTVAGRRHFEINSLAVAGSWAFASLPDRNGVFRSNDYGVNWTRCANGMPYTTPYCLLVHQERILAGTARGLCYSSDNGTTWMQAAGAVGSDSIFALSHDGASLVAGTSGGIFVSSDNGGSWIRREHGLATTRFSCVAVHGTAIIAGSVVDGAFRSIDFGQTWVSVNAGLPLYNINTLAFDADTLLVGTHYGAFRSTNLGDEWIDANRNMSTSLVGPLAGQGRFIFASVSTLLDGEVFRSSDCGDTWTPIQSSLPIKGPFISNGAYLFAAGGGGVCISSDSGASWTQSTNDGLFAFDPGVFAVQGSIVYAGAQYGGVCRSTNNGFTWRPKYEGLTSLLVTALAADNTILYAGTIQGGLVYRTLDSGQTWTTCSSGIPEYSVVYALFGRDPVVLAGTTGSGVYRSTDRGENWALSDHGVEGSMIHIRSFASTDSALFAGDVGDEGVAASFDWGLSWKLASNGLDNKSITSLLVHDEYLFAGTYAGGLWRRPLRELMELRDGGPDGIEEPKEPGPTEYSLSQNYPNPFNPSTSIGFRVSGLGFRWVRLVVYDLLGREVAVLVDEQKTPGMYTVTWDAAGMAGGVYFYRLTAGDFIETKKMILLK